MNSTVYGSARGRGDGLITTHIATTTPPNASPQMAMLSTGRKHFIGMLGAFHGKSLGSLAGTSKSVFRKPFEGEGEEVAILLCGIAMFVSKLSPLLHEPPHSPLKASCCPSRTSP